MKSILFIFLLFCSTCFSQKDSLITEAGVNPQFDNRPVELGMVFKTNAIGKVTNIRFWKTSKADASTITVNLYTIAGYKLATKKVMASNRSGWISVALDSPISIIPEQYYVVSFLTSVGRYAQANDFFATPRFGAYLTAPANAQVQGGNGRYAYGGGFPTTQLINTNYFVDVVFEAEVRRPLIVNAGRDTSATMPVDKIVLQGVVDGDGTVYKWNIEDSFGSISVDFNKLQATIRPSEDCWLLITLTGSDKWGNESTSVVEVEVLPDPAEVVAEVLRNGTIRWRRKPIFTNKKQ